MRLSVPPGLSGSQGECHAELMDCGMPAASGKLVHSIRIDLCAPLCADDRDTDCSTKPSGPECNIHPWMNACSVWRQIGPGRVS